MKQRLLLVLTIFIMLTTFVACGDTKYVDKSHNKLKFVIPNDWEQSSSSSNATLYLNNKDDADITLTIADTASNNMTLKDYTDIATRSYSSAFVTYTKSAITTNDDGKRSNVSVEEPDYTKVNDIELSKTKITYDYKSGDKNHKFTELVCCCIVDNQIYQFNFKVRSEEFSSYKENINTIIDSIKK